MSEKYEIQLGVGLNESELSAVKKVLQSIESQERKVEYNVDFNIKNLDKLTKVGSEIEKIQNQLNNIGSSKKVNTAIPIDSKQIETTLNNIHNSIKKLQNAFGRVDKNKGVQSLLTTVNKIGKSLETVSKQFEGLNKNLSSLTAKDFSLNFDFGIGNSSKNPEQAIKQLKMLRKEAEEYEDYFRRHYSLKGSNTDPINRLMLDYNQGNQKSILQLRQAMAGGSDVKQIAAYKEYIRLIKETAAIAKIPLEPVELRLAGSNEFANAKSEISETKKELQELFSGGINAENLHRTLDGISTDLHEISETLRGLSSGVSVEGLTQSFDRLSETIEKLVSNVALAKNALSDGFTSGTSIDTGAINKIENASDDSTATVIQNEKKKQEAYRATADTIQKVSRIAPMDAQLVNIMSSNIRDAAQKAGIDLKDYYHSLQHINAFQPTNADVALIADASESIVNRLGVDVYSDYIKKMREIAGASGQIVEAINSSEKEIAQVSTQAANDVVQAEERKQQAIRETQGIVSTAVKESIDNVSSQSIFKAFRVSDDDSAKFKQSMENLVSQWTDAKGELTDVKISTQTFYDEDTERNIERITRAQVTYNNELGETIKKTIAVRQLGTESTMVGGKEQISPIYGFSEVSAQYSKSLGKSKVQIDSFVKQQKQAVSNLTNQINQLNRASNDQNAPRAIKDSSHLNTLTSKYNDVISAIQRMGTASSDTFVDEQNNVKKLISEYKSLVSEYRNAENVSTKMKGTDFESGLGIAKNDLEKFKADAKDFPQILKTIEDLDKAISNVGDAASLNEFNDQLRVARSELAKIKSETSAANRSEKAGINVSGLQSKIANLQKISPEIDKFEAEINGSKVTVQSLLDDLNKVNTQSDFSVINSKWRAFTDAAKKAGIAVAETSEKVNALKRIDGKLKPTDGNTDYDRELNDVETSFAKLSNQSGELKAKISSLRQEFANIKAANADRDIDELYEANKRYEQILQDVNNQLKINKNEEDKQRRAEQDAIKSDALTLGKENAMLRLKNAFGEGSVAARKFASELDKIQKEIDECGDIGGLRNINKEINNLISKANAANYQTSTFGQRLKKQWSQYSAYLSVASVFMYAEQAMRSMFEQVKLIDTAMTELKKVTDESDASYNQFLSNAASRAKELGTTIDGLVSSTADFARLGYGFEDAQGLAEVANIYAVVGDEIEGVEDATKSLISTLAAFKDEASGISDSDFAMEIVDKFNEVSNNFAISSGGIGEAMQRSASSLRAANNTIDESIALITAANTVVQDPTQVGKSYADFKSGYIG